MSHSTILFDVTLPVGEEFYDVAQMQQELQARPAQTLSIDAVDINLAGFKGKIRVTWVTTPGSPQINDAEVYFGTYDFKPAIAPEIVPSDYPLDIHGFEYSVGRPFTREDDLSAGFLYIDPGEVSLRRYDDPDPKSLLQFHVRHKVCTTFDLSLLSNVDAALGGAPRVNIFYALYLIAKDDPSNPEVTFMLSENFSRPTAINAGFVWYRRIGSVRKREVVTDGTATLSQAGWQMTMRRKGQIVDVDWNEPLNLGWNGAQDIPHTVMYNAVIDSGSILHHLVNCEDHVPPINNASLKILVKANTSDNSRYLTFYPYKRRDPTHSSLFVETGRRVYAPHSYFEFVPFQGNFMITPSVSGIDWELVGTGYTEDIDADVFNPFFPVGSPQFNQPHWFGQGADQFGNSWIEHIWIIGEGTSPIAGLYVFWIEGLRYSFTTSLAHTFADFVSFVNSVLPAGTTAILQGEFGVDHLEIHTGLAVAPIRFTCHPLGSMLNGHYGQPPN